MLQTQALKGCRDSSVETPGSTEQGRASSSSQPVRRILRQAWAVEEGKTLPAARCSPAGAQGQRAPGSPHCTLSFPHAADPISPGQSHVSCPAAHRGPAQMPGCKAHQCLNPTTPGSFRASSQLRSCLSAFLDKNFLIHQVSACRAGTALLPCPLFKGWENAVALPGGSCALGWEGKRLGSPPPSLLHPAGAGAGSEMGGTGLRLISRGTTTHVNFRFLMGWQGIWEGGEGNRIFLPP